MPGWEGGLGGFSTEKGEGHVLLAAMTAVPRTNMKPMASLSRTRMSRFFTMVIGMQTTITLVEMLAVVMLVWDIELRRGMSIYLQQVSSHQLVRVNSAGHSSTEHQHGLHLHTMHRSEHHSTYGLDPQPSTCPTDDTQTT